MALQILREGDETAETQSDAPDITAYKVHQET